MAVEMKADVQGLDELEAGLKGMRRALQRKTLRKPLFESMELLRKTVRGRAPILNLKKRGSKWMHKVGARKRGLVRDSIKTLWSKLQQRRGDAGVWVTATRPNPTQKTIKEGGGKKTAITARRRGMFNYLRRDGGRGALYRPNDPFYFKFLEQGTKKRNKIPAERYQFIGRTASGLQGQITLKTFIRTAGEAISKLKASETK